MLIYLGNTDSAVTIVDPPDGTPPSEILASLKSLWPYHSDDDPGWVSCDDTSLLPLLAAEFNCKTKTFSAAQKAYTDALGVSQ